MVVLVGGVSALPSTTVLLCPPIHLPFALTFDEDVLVPLAKCQGHVAKLLADGAGGERLNGRVVGVGTGVLTFSTNGTVRVSLTC